MDFETREIRTAQGRKRPLREQETCFLLTQQGLSNNQACRIVGINGRRAAGGVTAAARPQAEGGTSGSAGGAAFWHVQVPARTGRVRRKPRRQAQQRQHASATR